MATLQFVFDFASPNAYLVHRVLPDFCRAHGAEVEYLPCLLGGIFKATGNQAPMITNANVPAKLAYEELEMRRFIDRHSLQSFRMNEHFPVTTLTLMRGAIAAQDAVVFDRYVEAGLVAMWEQSRNMAEPEVFVAAMEAAGLDGEALLAATGDGAVKSRLIDNTTAAVQRGVFGIPTFFVGDDMYFGKERLDQVGAALASMQ